MSIADANTCNSEERKAIAEWWRQDDRRLFGTDVVEAAIENGAYEHQFALVLREDQGPLVGRVNGNCSLGLARIDGLIVKAHERGKGHGATLLAAAEEVCIEHGAKSIVLLTDTAGTASFYKRFGFHVEHELHNWTAGLTFVQMRKILT